jgi:hypothetical protein
MCKSQDSVYAIDQLQDRDMDKRVTLILLKHGENLFMGFKELVLQSNGRLLISAGVP